MQQSNVIFAALVIGFILFITNKGELGTYIQLLRGGGAQTPLAPAGSSGGGGITGALGSLANLGNIGDFNNPLPSLNVFNENPISTPGLG